MKNEVLTLPDMKAGVLIPPDVKLCLFEVTQKYCYSETAAFAKELARANYPENILSEWMKDTDSNE
jgi:hypothetical protein